MNELIKIEKQVIGDEEINAVDARELHEFLEVKKQFTDWIKPKIKDYGFVINSDFYPSSCVAENGRKMETYIISIDMAKELSMLSQTNKGKEARQYFISMQRKAENILESLEHLDYIGNINDLVYSKNGESYTTSRIIAKKFNKEHYHVLEAIDVVISKGLDSDKIMEFNATNFRGVEYVDKKQELRRAYDLTEAGFAIVVLGFTGKKVLEFEIDFVTAFQQMRQALTSRFKAETVRKVLPTANDKRNFVYIIGNSENELLKIGVSKDVEKRIKQLQTGSWSKLSILYTSMVCSNSFDIETIVHQQLKDKQVNGEWYNVAYNRAVSIIETQVHTLESSFIRSYYEDDKAIFKMM